jgi:hypothetical protein
MQRDKQTGKRDPLKKGARTMEPEGNGTQPPESEDHDRFNLVGRAPIALVLGVCVVLILNLFNRGGRFALLSAFFSILFYLVLIIVQGLRHPEGPAPSSGPVPEGQEVRQAVMALIFRGLPYACVQTIVGGVGLFFLPNQQSLVFAVISGILGFLLCQGLFGVGLLTMGLFFIASRARIGSGEG